MSKRTGRRTAVLAAVAAVVAAGLLVPVAPRSAAADPSTPWIVSDYAGGYLSTLTDTSLRADGFVPGAFSTTPPDARGCDTREQALIATSSTPTTVGDGCTISGGTWTSRYDGVTLTDPDQVVVDHLVPLSEAWASGAYAWTPAQRAAFAADQGSSAQDPVVTELVPASADSAAAKGDSGPTTWQPSVDTCRYATSWITVKYRWGLTTTPAEYDALVSILSSPACRTRHPPLFDVEIAIRIPPAPPASDSRIVTTPWDGAVYAVPASGPMVGRVRLSDLQLTYLFDRTNRVTSPTEYVKYPWSPTLYAVTYWSGGSDPSGWEWHRLTYPEWQRAGMPRPRTAGFIAGSSYYKWGTGPAIYVTGEDGSLHALTAAEYAAAGRPAFDNRYDQGYQKLTWSNQIAFMSDIHDGWGWPISYAQWQAAQMPTPRAYPRLQGDQFNHDACSSTIVYSGPTMSRPITLAEYDAAWRPFVPSQNFRECPGGRTPIMPQFYDPGQTRPGTPCPAWHIFGEWGRQVTACYFNADGDMRWELVPTG